MSTLRIQRHIILLVIIIVALFAINLFSGSVSIPVADVYNIIIGGSGGKETWRYIIMESRLPQAVTATLCGGALAVSGLLLQTAFRNPLAGPSIFGINSGAGLGVATVMLLMGGSVSIGTLSATGFVAVFAAAFAGSMAVTALIFFFSNLVRSNVMLLIIGIMIGYLSSAAITLLNYFATEEGVKSYLIWGMGNFGGVSTDNLPFFSITIIMGIVASLMLVKPLNALLLGEQYAENLGINTRRLRNRLLIITGILTAVTTAFCGPVAFIGLAVPHIARLILSSENHHRLLPMTILCGSAVALLCNIACTLPPSGGMIPLNAVTPVIGAPVIIYVIMKQRE